MDEYRHAAEKLKKTENVIEKYKKKLEESADLRRQMKVRPALLSLCVLSVVVFEFPLRWWVYRGG